MVAWLCILGMIFVSALLQGLTGFGFGMVAIPMLTIEMDVHRAVIVATALAVVACLHGAVVRRRVVNWRVARLWTLGALAGLPAGVVLFVLMPASMLTLLVAVSITMVAVVLLADVHAGAPQTWRALVSVGASAGVLGGAIGMAGPPIALHSTWSRYPKDAYQATAALFGAIVSTVALFGYGIAGELSRHDFLLSASSVPALLLGTVGGLQINKFLPQAWFRRVVLVSLIGLALTMFIRAA